MSCKFPNCTIHNLECVEQMILIKKYFEITTLIPSVINIILQFCFNIQWYNIHESEYDRIINNKFEYSLSRVLAVHFQRKFVCHKRIYIWNVFMTTLDIQKEKITDSSGITIICISCKLLLLIFLLASFFLLLR